MTTRLSTRLVVAAFALSGAFVLANCNKPAPEPQTPVVELPAPIVVQPKAAPVAVRKVVAMTSATALLEQKAKGLLNAGADVDIAVQGFQSPQEFMATAYASKNLNVPFMLLKDKVVTQKMTLARAITASSRYSVNAPFEAARAESEARADLARKTGPQ